MNQEQFIIIEDLCKYYCIEVSFVKNLNENGMIQLIVDNESQLIHHDEIRNIERYIHLHYELGINLEGLDAISHLLERIENLQNELRHIKAH